jgi:hypothetical protein
MGKPKETITIDADLLDGITKKLLQIEAWAEGLREECCKTRKLIEKAGSVSTPSKGQQVLSQEQLAAISMKRRMRIFKKMQKT